MQAGQGDACRLLLRRGALVDARSEMGSTALHVASQRGHVSAAQALLEHGAAADASFRQGATSLHLAAVEGHAGDRGQSTCGDAALGHVACRCTSHPFTASLSLILCILATQA